MHYLDILRLVSLFAWLTVAIASAGSFVRIYRGRARYYDLMGALLSANGFLYAAFNLRWFIPPSDGLNASLYVFGIFLAFMILRAAKRYSGAMQ